MVILGVLSQRSSLYPGLKITDRAFGTGWRMPIAPILRHLSLDRLRYDGQQVLLAARLG